MAVVSPTPSFLLNRTAPGLEWKRVGYLNVSDPTQLCPDLWQIFPSPISACRKKTTAPCNSFNIPTSGASYKTVCGWFRGYQIGTLDGFHNFSLPQSIESYYVDGVEVTYGVPGNRHHVYTYAVGNLYVGSYESSCPCAGGAAPPDFVGSDYYCESGNPDPSPSMPGLFYPDVLWDGQQCDGNESTCCQSSNLPWFCKTFAIPITEDLEVRICTDEDVDNEDVAVQSFELYIQGEVNLSSVNQIKYSCLVKD